MRLVSRESDFNRCRASHAIRLFQSSDPDPRGMATISAIMMGQVGEKGDGLVSESYE
jgi:hypothetical protein